MERYRRRWFDRIATINSVLYVPKKTDSRRLEVAVPESKLAAEEECSALHLYIADWRVFCPTTLFWTWGST